jgi:hypothetical protein
LKDIYQKFGSIRGLGMDRYTTLRSAFNPSIDKILEICSLPRTTFVEFVDNVELAVVDESVLAYQPSKKVKEMADTNGEPIPVVYIPRKPHPNGLEIFLVTTPIEDPTSQKEKLPYIVDIVPYLRNGDNVPSDIIRTFMKHWGRERKPHIIGDSLFSSFDLMKEINEWGSGGTFSMQGKFD